MLNTSLTQAQFASIVGIGQSAVSDLLARGVIKPGMLGGAWVRDYCSNLREQAAGRGADGELAHQRSELARVSRERAEIKLRVERKEFTAVTLLELVLATVGRSISGSLEPLHVALHKRIPELSPEALKIVQTEVAKACDIAVTASLSLLEVTEEERQADAAGLDAEPEGLADFEPSEESAAL